MKYGFVIDNRKCIGCHACTTACKSEHDVPVGVFRTWVKQVEKGTFPNTRRVFSVLRCNHCTDAPCVEICPVEALYTRPDGIVDFNKDRCIGCKSCMQACPYDALYIDPDTHTAAKCNYCAHRVDVGLEPACVVVCPEHAIVSGDMEDPNSEISQTLSRHQTTVRKPEKATVPNLYYIDGDAFSLSPSAAEQPDDQLWSAQTRGVGHYAKHTERMAWQGEDIVKELLEKSATTVEEPANGEFSPPKSIEVLTGHNNAKRVYNAPGKGVLWGWEVPAYVTTKAISAGVYFLAAWLQLNSHGSVWSDAFFQLGVGISLVFLLLTTALLVKDLDQPKRFLYVILRPQWRSWLVRGGYALSLFGGVLTLQLAGGVLGMEILVSWLVIPGLLLALVVAVYTAFLFAQARGRDFWQSPVLPLHMIIHSLMAGAAMFILLDGAGFVNIGDRLTTVFVAAIAANLIILAIELYTTHPTADAKAVVKMITKGKYRQEFWMVLLACNALPALALYLDPLNTITQVLASVLVLWGIYRLEKIWIEAPQKVALA
ncbi:MAG: polysulfide reductase NrfD [Lewinellaceae bacterium]|nr:polysulfide reductase NrfD [Saprospiraceae bacterium]MCB9331228.1 polysulfide reductase NrfD [Lewinellaceae bacterium]